MVITQPNIDTLKAQNLAANKFSQWHDSLRPDSHNGVIEGHLEKLKTRAVPHIFDS